MTDSAKTIRRPSFAAVMCVGCGISCGAVAYAARENVGNVVLGIVIVSTIFMFGCMFAGLEE